MSGEVLSQNEIDALLSAISTGEMDAEELKKEEKEKKVKVYDFKRALRFSKDQIRSLTRIHDNFARLLTTHFSAQLRTYIHISVSSVDQVPYEEFIRSIPNMTILNLFDVHPMEGRIMMEVNPTIAYTMMDRVMGGIGISHNKVDSLTEIETKIISNLFENALGNYKEASFSIGSDGKVSIVDAEGKTQDGGQIGIVTFANSDGLDKIGSNLYRESLNSGTASAANQPGDGGTGALKSGFLEMSNVDLTDEFTEMIVAQRGFQSNSKIITTSDEILQELVNLKR